MNSAKTIDEDTPHVPSQPKFARAAMKTVKIIVFLITFGMVYPHVFTDEG